jgi:hypothetical protein
MKIRTYLYVITERYPKSGTPHLNENRPQLVVTSEEEAKEIVDELRSLVSPKSEPIFYEYVKVPFVQRPSLLAQDRADYPRPD